MKEIIKKLKDLGYFVGDHKEYLIVGEFKEYDPTLKANILENTLSITPKNGKYIVNYFKGQIPKETEFSSTKVLVEFVKQQFPLTKL